MELDGGLSRVCSVCAREFAKYTCPRCAVQSCSLACYRTHGAACTDAFQRDQAQSAARAECAPAKDEMEDILRRVRAQTLDDGGPDGGGSSDPVAEAAAALAHERRVHALQALASAGQLGKIDLSADEMLDFERYVANGSLARHLERTVPWWAVVPASSVERLADGTYLARDTRAPRMIDALPPISELTSRTPPAAMRFVVLELLGAYAYVHRLFDCDPSADAADAAACLLQLSAALSGDERGAFANAQAALGSVCERCAHPLTRTSREFTAASLTDLRALLGAAHLPALALSDLHGILGARHVHKGARGISLQLAARKALFLASWWCSHADSTLSATCAELDAAVGAHLAALSSLAHDEAALRRQTGPQLGSGSVRLSLNRLGGTRAAFVVEPLPSPNTGAHPLAQV